MGTSPPPEDDNERTLDLRLEFDLPARAPTGGRPPPIPRRRNGPMVLTAVLVLVVVVGLVAGWYVVVIG